MHLRPNCGECHYPLWDVFGTGLHANPRCDPDTPPWWELPEWAEWLRAAVSDRNPDPAVLTLGDDESG